MGPFGMRNRVGAAIGVARRSSWPLRSHPGVVWSVVAMLLTSLVGVAPAHGQAGDPAAHAWDAGGPPPSAASAPVMPWQRDLDDALALSRATGKPLLVCVNTDGEQASDALASRRYHDPDFAALVQGFIPVLASPDLHSALPDGADRDSRGRRVLCPRFGRLVCGEHVAIEPLVFARWFDGTRVAPRHVGVSPDGKVLFDLYLLNDLSKIDRALEQHGRFDVSLPDPASLDDAALLESRDAAARVLLEQRFPAADEATRLAWLASVGTKGLHQPTLLHLGLRDPSAAVRAAAFEALAAMAASAPVALLVEGSRQGWDRPALFDGLVKALARAGVGDAGDPHALRLATLLGAARSPSSVVDRSAWSAALAGPPFMELPALDGDELYEWVGRLGDELERSPDDVELRATLAGALLDMADSYVAAGTDDVGWLWESALEEARRATAMTDAPPLAWASLARADWYLGGSDVAADAASRALPGLLDEAGSLLACDLLDLLVQTRSAQALAALDAGEAWPDAWLADAVAAAQVLVRHPRAADWQVASALDVLGGLELDALHARLTREAIVRFPSSGALHEHLRWSLLRDGDAAAVVAAYDALALGGGRSTQLWFSAYAALAAGDHLRDEGRGDEAAAVYRTSLERFAGVSIERTLAGTDDFMGLAHAGLARVALADGRPDDAAAELGLALAAGPGCVDLPDGAGVTPAETAGAVAAALRRGRQPERALALEQLVDAARTGG